MTSVVNDNARLYSTNTEAFQRLGGLIKRRREEMRVSQRTAAAGSGLSVNIFNRLEMGKGSKPTAMTLRKVETYLGWPRESIDRFLATGEEPQVTVDVIEPNQIETVSKRQDDLDQRLVVLEQKADRILAALERLRDV